MGYSRIKTITIQVTENGIWINMKAGDGREVTIPKTLSEDDADEIMESFRKKASNVINGKDGLFKSLMDEG